MAEKKQIDIEIQKIEIIKQCLKNVRNKGHMGTIDLSITYIGEGIETKKNFFVVNISGVGINKNVYFSYGDTCEELRVAMNEKTNQQIMPLDGSYDELSDLQPTIKDLNTCVTSLNNMKNGLATTLQMNEREICGIYDINLRQKVIENGIEDTKEQTREEGKETGQISKEEAKKIGISENGLNSVRTNTPINSTGDTLGTSLGLEDFESLIVVKSDRLAELDNAEGKKGRVNPMTLSLVGKKKDGTLQSIGEDKLIPDGGANNNAIVFDGEDEVEFTQTENKFRVPNSNKIISIKQINSLGRPPEVYFGRTDTTNTINVMQKVNDEKSRKGPTGQKMQVRTLFNSQYYIDTIREEVKEHTNYGCQSLEEDAVGGSQTSGHIHFDPNSPEQQSAIDYIVEKSAVSPDNRIPRKKAEEMLKEELEQNVGGSIEEAKNNVIDKINEQYRGRSGQQKR